MQQEILDFWFNQIEQKLWWQKDDAFDRLITKKYSAIHQQASRCELYYWRESAQGRLAEIIILDQFSRNMFRDSALAFANDSLALTLAQEAVSSGADKELSELQRGVLYLPYMHSESRKIHDVALVLYKQNGIQTNYDFELKHKKIIDQFGRYPHRNKILDRQSTKEELAFLTLPGSGF